jgi:hypothetical protein
MCGPYHPAPCHVKRPEWTAYRSCYANEVGRRQHLLTHWLAHQNITRKASARHVYCGKQDISLGLLGR